MKMLFKQRFFSWFDSYDIYDEAGNVLYVVKGQLAWGHRLKVFDPAGRELGLVQEKIFTWLPKFEIYIGGQYMGRICREFTFFKPHYDIDFMGWSIDGNFLEWDYTVYDPSGSVAAVISKELLHWTDTYSIEVADRENALPALMFVLAVDAEKCSRRS